MKRIQQSTSGLTLNIKTYAFPVHPNYVGKREVGSLSRSRKSQIPSKVAAKPVCGNPNINPAPELPADKFTDEEKPTLPKNIGYVPLLIPGHLVVLTQ